MALEYYKHFKNLRIPYAFKTINGIDYDENGIKLGHWIAFLRRNYRGANNIFLSDEKIKLLDDIEMHWFDKIDNTLQLEIIDEENIKRKKIEIINRFKTLLNHYKDDYSPTKEEINQKFTLQLNDTKGKFINK